MSKPELSPEQLTRLRERQARNAKAWRERHPDRYKNSRRLQDAKRVIQPSKARTGTPSPVEHSKGGRPPKILANRPAAIALRERFFEWREERKAS